PYSTIGCALQSDPIETSRDHRCLYRWQREAAEDRERSDEYFRNARRKANDAQKLLTDQGGIDRMEATGPIKVGA
ncbi:MAG: hypothetical protein IH628_10945, partial [Proteobacteria bacterium]|nr:hypothetical protein [Pseudomonadota bacterium]